MCNGKLNFLYANHRQPQRLLCHLFIILILGVSPSHAQTAAENCIKIGGKPHAEAPISKKSYSEYFSRLARARPHCEAALIGAKPDATALFQIGVMMQREGSHKHAINFFELASLNGVAAAYTKLGDYLQFGIGSTQKDLASAVANYNKAIRMDDVAAKATIAMMYGLGQGVRQDSEKMFKLLLEAAETNYHFAQLRIADIYLNPRSVPPKMARDMKLPDPVQALEYLQLAAAQGSTEAQNKISDIHSDTGKFSNPKIKFKLIQHAANGGDAKALNELGFMFERGEGVDYNPSKAAQLYIAALETGNLDIAKIRGTIEGYTPAWDRETALEFQSILKARGFYFGTIDAQIGFGTLSAARLLAKQ